MISFLYHNLLILYENSISEKCFLTKKNLSLDLKIEYAEISSFLISYVYVQDLSLAIMLSKVSLEFDLHLIMS